MFENAEDPDKFTYDFMIFNSLLYNPTWVTTKKEAEWVVSWHPHSYYKECHDKKGTYYRIYYK